VQRDGRIVVVGGTSAVTVARYNPNGNPDTTFALTGMLSIFSIQLNSPPDFAIQSDGKVVLALRTPDGLFVLLRFHANGLQDSSFAAGGKLTVNLGQGTNPAFLAIQPDGRIILTGDAVVTQTVGFAVARFLNDNPSSDANQRFVTHLY